MKNIYHLYVWAQAFQGNYKKKIQIALRNSKSSNDLMTRENTIFEK